MSAPREPLACPFCDGSGEGSTHLQTGRVEDCGACKGTGWTFCDGDEDGTPCGARATVRGLEYGTGYCDRHGEGL